MSNTIKECIALDVSTLPKSAQTLVSLIGLQATGILIEKHGGKELALYARGDSLDRLGAIIGLPEAEILHGHFGPTPFTVPRCTSLLCNIRNAKIHAMYDSLTTEGISGRAAIHQIIEVFGLTERHIFRIFKMPTFLLPETKKPA